MLASEATAAKYFQPIYGSRVEPVPPRAVWRCYRCGQTVDDRKGGWLVPNAPCHDCREVLREEYGELTAWDRRTRPPAPPVPFPIANPGPVDVVIVPAWTRDDPASVYGIAS